MFPIHSSADPSPRPCWRWACSLSARSPICSFQSQVCLVSIYRPSWCGQTGRAPIPPPLPRRSLRHSSVGSARAPGWPELHSISTLGSTVIPLQFDLGRNVDGAARDVQAALNAASADLPLDLPQTPGFNKVNPVASPMLILALTSKTIGASAIYDIAD